MGSQRLSEAQRLTPHPTPDTPQNDDHKDELVLLLDIWKDIRQGNVQSAIAQCNKRSSYWRAALLQGGHLHGGHLHRPAIAAPYWMPYDEEPPEDEDHAANDAHGTDWGNPERALWLRTCWDLGRKALDAAAAGVGAMGAKGGDDVALMEALIMSKYTHV